MKYLGIDYGTKRIGIATSDGDGRVAFPKQVIANDNKIIEVIENIIRNEGIEIVVLGESKNYQMEDNDIMTEVLDLKKIIETQMEIDVKLHSEVLSSVQAKKMGASDAMLDASAAAVILQSYLDSKNV